MVKVVTQDRFLMPSAFAGAVLAVMAALLALVHPVHAQGDVGSCAAGRAVADAANNPGLVSDCETLLASRDTLAGIARLNWSANTPIAEWQGVTVGRHSAAGYEGVLDYKGTYRGDTHRFG